MIIWFLALFQKNEQTRERWKKWSFLALIIVLSIPYVMMTKNIVVKIVPLGKEIAVANIQDSEIIKATGRLPLSNTYTITVTFTDQNNVSYKTKKDVSRYTYYKYVNYPYILISYRKKFPNEIFIDTHSVGEIISAIFRHSNFALLLNVSLLIYFIKKFIDTWGIPFVKKK